jgi:hypothetical protein
LLINFQKEDDAQLHICAQGWMDKLKWSYRYRKCGQNVCVTWNSIEPVQVTCNWNNKKGSCRFKYTLVIK